MPKKSIWTEPSRYGTYDGPKGDPQKWAGIFSASFENSESVKSIVGMNAYEILGLRPSATDEEVAKTYRRLARLHHPDKGGDRLQFEKITTAYTTIKTMRDFRRPTPRPTTPVSPSQPADLIVPQLLTPIEESEIERYLSDPDFGAQEKKDGRHLTLQIINGQFFVRNKKGIASSCAPEFEQSLRQIGHDILIDGEQIGTTFWVWDILENCQDLRSFPYLTRYNMLAQLNFGPTIKILELVTDQRKRVLFNKLKAAGKEGIVFKKLSGVFKPGKGDDQLKFKFYSECSVIVAPGRSGKASIGMELIGPNGREFVGYCSCSTHPPIGSVVEVKYLYAYRGGGCLYQTAFKEMRDDVDVEECTLDQLKYKSEED